MIDNGLVVRRKNFKTQSIIGTPEITINYLQRWKIDEIFFINVGEKNDISEILKLASKKCFIPITVGGNISSLEDVNTHFLSGADKVVIGKYASKDLLTSISDKYGNQSICLSVDKDHYNIPNWPCGEIILHDTSRDGMGKGLNIDILKQRTEKPIIAMGGVGNFEHIVEGLVYADAVAVGNLFHFKEISAIQAKKKCIENGQEVRI